MRDVSRAGHELGSARVEGLPAVATLGEILRARIHADVARYNADPGRVFACLVQPADSIRHRDGHHMRAPRPLDADRLHAAAQEAVEAGILWFVLGEERLTDLAHRIDVEQADELVAVLRRPVVAEVA